MAASGMVTNSCNRLKTPGPLRTSDRTAGLGLSSMNSRVRGEWESWDSAPELWLRGDGPAILFDFMRSIPMLFRWLENGSHI